MTLQLRVTLIAMTCLLLTLTLVGGGTAILLQHRARASLDRTLLAAAYAEAHPWQDERFQNKHVGSPVQVKLWNPDHPVVAPRLHAQAVQTKRPVWVDEAGLRVLLLAVQSVEHPDTVHSVVVATAPSSHWHTTALPFLLAYSTVSLLVTSLTGLALFLAVFRSLSPLDRAACQIGEVGALQVGRRLDVDGPPEIQRLLSATNGLLDRLERAFTAQTSFTSQAAHELRTPVTVLKGEIELALRRARSIEEHRVILHRLQGNVDRMQDLVEGLLLLARVDTGQIEQGRTNERISTPLHSALAQELPGLQAVACGIDVQLGPDPELSIHVALLTTAIATLLRNCALHAPGATVHLRTAIQDGNLRIEIRDDGPGIHEPLRMLERFTRTSPAAGLGLGLPIAREIARRHGGDLSLASTPGTGTTTVLLLPILSSL